MSGLSVELCGSFDETAKLVNDMDQTSRGYTAIPHLEHRLSD